MSELFSEQSRIRAVFVNNGIGSLEEADAKLCGLSLTVALGPAAALSRAGQAAFLTAVATAARSFGRVDVTGELDAPLTLPLPLCQQTLGAAAVALGARIATRPAHARAISIGPSVINAPWVVQAQWSGWTAAVLPDDEHALGQGEDFALAGVAAGALAVGQAFFAECGDVLAGRREQRLSLWDPLALDAPLPRVNQVALPAALWLIGIGNLGQANLWSLSTLPYANPSDLLLFLQDDDTVDRDNWGPSILVQRGKYGALKTRLAEEWALSRGFQVRRIDRRVDEHQRRKFTEPGVTLAGLDRMPARRLLGLPGFDYVIDAGLGASAQTFQHLRINVFDGGVDPASHFAGVEDETNAQVERLLKQPAYQAIAARMNDGACGAAMLAEKSVAAPFVSAVAGALAVAQAIRLTNGYAPYRALTLDVSDARSAAGTLGLAPERPNIPRANAA